MDRNAIMRQFTRLPAIFALARFFYDQMPIFGHFLSTYVKAGVTALLPCSCALCGETSDELICPACHRQFFTSSRSRCVQCAIPLSAHDEQRRCGDCLKTSPYFDHTVTAIDYAAPADQLILALKFGHRLALADLLSNMLRDAILQEPQQHLADLLCPVPLGRQRLVERGFNQSLEIAKPLSTHLGVKLQPDLLCRCRDTAQQSSLHPDDRHKNVHKAFTLNDTAIALIKGRHIGVIDDVMTTGTTLNEIAGLLKRFGAAKVSNYVFARTPLR